MKKWIVVTILAVVVLVAAGIAVGVSAAATTHPTAMGDKDVAPPPKSTEAEGDSSSAAIIVPPNYNSGEGFALPESPGSDASEESQPPSDVPEPSPPSSNVPEESQSPPTSQDMVVNCDKVDCPPVAHTFPVNNGRTFTNVCGANDANGDCQAKKEEKCCTYIPLCGGYTCTAEYKKVAANDEKQCRNGTCDDSQCCEPPLCGEYTCSEGYNKAANKDRTKCRNGSCDDDQCCYKAPTCGEGDCPDGKRRMPGNVCMGYSCTVDECCVDKATCGSSFDCDSDQANKPSNTECAGEACMKEECCEKLTCKPGSEPKNGKCVKCGKELPVVEGVTVGVWQPNKCQYNCKFGFVKSRDVCTCPYLITKTGNMVACGVDMANTVVTDTKVYNNVGNLMQESAKEKCPEWHTFFNYDKAKCEAYAKHKELPFQSDKNYMMPKGCTQTPKNVYFNTQSGQELCNNYNRNSQFNMICRTSYDTAQSVGFCKMTPSDLNAKEKAAAEKAAAEKAAAEKAAAEKAAAEKAAAEKAAAEKAAAEKAAAKRLQEVTKRIENHLESYPESRTSRGSPWIGPDRDLVTEKEWSDYWTNKGYAYRFCEYDHDLKTDMYWCA